MRKTLLSFADSRLHRSAKRLQRQAEALNIFDDILLLDETKLPSEFISMHRSNLIFGSRGFGYWCWKPQVIYQTLETLDIGDMLLYVNVGCHLNPGGRDRMHDYIMLAHQSSSGLLAFQAVAPSAPLIYDGQPLPDLSEFRWAKGDLLDFFHVRDQPSVINTQAIGAGVILIRKCDRSIALIRKWLEVVNTKFSLLDDSPSASPNMDGFVEHRHDQSIFSILCKTSNVDILSAYEYWYPKRDSNEADWAALDKFPIHARRDLNYGLRDFVFRSAGHLTTRLIRQIKR